MQTPHLNALVGVSSQGSGLKFGLGMFSTVKLYRINLLVSDAIYTIYIISLLYKIKAL